MMKKITIEIKWGIIFFLMMLVWMFLEKISGLHSIYIDQHMIYTNLVAIPSIAVYVLALLDKKRNYYGGTMNYLDGLISGLIITFVVTILSPLSLLITTYVITPEFFPNAIAFAVESGKMTQTEAEKYFSVNNYMIQGLMGAPVMGVITSVIVAFFTRTKSK